MFLLSKLLRWFFWPQTRKLHVYRINRNVSPPDESTLQPVRESLAPLDPRD